MTAEVSGDDLAKLSGSIIQAGSKSFAAAAKILTLKPVKVHTCSMLGVDIVMTLLTTRVLDIETIKELVMTQQ